MNTSRAGGPKNEVGVAAFLDLKDSTRLWNVYPDLAEEVLDSLATVAIERAARWGGKFGNFTGDGFLFLFSSVEHAVHGLAEILDVWEPLRLAFLQRCSLEEIHVADPTSLTLRSGVAFGNYRAFHRAGRHDFTGDAINRASRCEAGSKEHADVALADLRTHQRIFVVDSAYELIRSKNEFHCTPQLPVRLKGYEGSYSLRAVWPRHRREASSTLETDLSIVKQGAALTAMGYSLVEAADGLAPTRVRLAVAAELQDAAMEHSGKARVALLERAAGAYREALRYYTPEVSREGYATTQNSLADTLCDEADLLPAQARGRKLTEAIAAYKEALRYRTPDSAGDGYATTQNNLGTALGSQADLLEGSARRAMLDEAIGAYREALRFRTPQSAPADYAMTLYNLANTTCRQAEFLGAEARSAALQWAIDAYKDALRFRTLDSSPRDYAATQNNLGNALGYDATFLSGDARKRRLEEAAHAYREAVRVSVDNEPQHDHSMSFTNLGNVLCDQAELLSDAEARARTLEMAEAAYRDAMRFFTAETPAAKIAGTLGNLGTALRAQANLLEGDARTAKLEDAVTAYRTAIQLGTADDSPSDYAARHNNLGEAYLEQACFLTGPPRKKRLEDAAAAYREAVRSFRRETSPDRFEAASAGLARVERELNRDGGLT